MITSNSNEIEPGTVYLIAGLGNPGTKYRCTRHNIGFRIIDLWSHEMGLRLSGRRFQSRSIQTDYNSEQIMLLCPWTFMNRSGEALISCIKYYGLGNDRILVVHDDLDMPVGRIKLVFNGGAGGHKGILSIMDHLGSRNFSRVKIGIGRPRHGESVEDYVLSPFYSDERKIIEKVSMLSIQACKLFISEGIQSAMNQVNACEFSNIEAKDLFN